MGISCGASCAKLILFIFNFVFFVTGAAILGVGIWLQVDPNAFNYLRIVQVNQNDQVVQAAVIVMICVGAFVFLVGFLGCCGACKESSCMLCAYTVLLGCLLILLSTAGILGAVFRAQVDTFLQNEMLRQVKNEYKYLAPGDKDALTTAWDALHYGLKCCGSQGPRDFYASKWYNASLAANNTDEVPVTCCIPEGNADPTNPTPKNRTICMQDAAAENTNSTYLYTKGCYLSFLDLASQYSDIIIGVAFGLLVIQIVGICLACCLRNSILDDN